jgi:hypothetical protein
MTKKHGQARDNFMTSEYRTWLGMRQRCSNPNKSCYKYYGARGIKVCDRWNNSFEAFFADMGKKPTPKYTLERVDNNGNYCPENCKWIHNSEQPNNRGNVSRYEFNNKYLTLKEIALELGLKKHTIYSRISRGWDPQKALSEPIKNHKLGKYEYLGEHLTLTEINRRLGFPSCLIWKRLKRGWTFEDAISMPSKRAMGAENGN